jgi:coenzyme F420-reducing hydrogenase delta subunit
VIVQESYNSSSVRVYFCRNTYQGNGNYAALQKLGQRDDLTVEAVPCTGKIDARYLLRAFEGGASAVCILACPSGDCKLMEGNLRAGRRVHAVRDLLTEAGLDPDSLKIFLPVSPEDASIQAAVTSATRFVDEEMQMASRVVA